MLVSFCLTPKYWIHKHHELALVGKFFVLGGKLEKKKKKKEEKKRKKRGKEGEGGKRKGR
jgi:hypothetical protein